MNEWRCGYARRHNHDMLPARITLPLMNVARAGGWCRALDVFFYLTCGHKVESRIARLAIALRLREFRQVYLS